jgi:Family of unknown function (DUF6052)
MTNVTAELTDIEQRQLKDAYRLLRQLAQTVTVPGVQAAVRLAVADLHSALEGQALEFDFYTHRWDQDQADSDQALAS